MSDIFDDIMGDRQRRMKKEQEEFDTLFGHRNHRRGDEDHVGEDDGHHHDHEHCDGCDRCEDVDQDELREARRHARMLRERGKDEFDWPN